MSYILKYTNPSKVTGHEEWKCAACNSKYSTADEARRCAVKDHKTGRHKR